MHQRVTVPLIASATFPHPLGKAIGAWPAVAVSAALLAAAAAALLDRPRVALN